MVRDGHKIRFRSPKVRFPSGWSWKLNLNKVYCVSVRQYHAKIHDRNTSKLQYRPTAVYDFALLYLHMN
jgi:hypothetical protein